MHREGPVAHSIVRMPFSATLWTAIFSSLSVSGIHRFGHVHPIKTKGYQPFQPPSSIVTYLDAHIGGSDSDSSSFLALSLAEPADANVPKGCPSRAFAVPIADGGLNNILRRALASIYFVNKTRERTLLLPYVRTSPVAYKPLRGAMGPSTYISFSHIFDVVHFCAALRDADVCILCEHSPGPAAAFLQPDDNGHVRKSAFDAIKMKPEQFKWVEAGVDDAKVPTQDWLILRHAVRPHRRLEARIQRIRKRLPHKFMAVHMRIENDWQRFARGRFYVAPSQIVTRVARDVRVRRFIADNAPPHGQPNVIFASSGAKARAVAAWEELGSGRYRAVTSPRESSLCWTAMAVVDYELCLEADLFVGCAKSTFFLDIARLRNLSHFGPSLAYAPGHSTDLVSYA